MSFQKKLPLNGGNIGGSPNENYAHLTKIGTKLIILNRLRQFYSFQPSKFKWFIQKFQYFWASLQ